MHNVNNFDEALKVMQQAGVEPILNQQSNHVQLSRELADELIAKMTLKEKVYMTSGHWKMLKGQLHGRVYNYDPIEGGGCKRLGIPAIGFSDGPRGVVMGDCTAFPTSNLRACAFDENLEAQFGEAVAKEMIALKANYFAGVCINLLRHPAWGRAQEAYGEDQFLLGKYGSALTRALQKYGIIACPKHYAGNSIENLRFSVSANMSKETFKDVYGYHFEECFNAGAGSVMCAYNRFNGEYCGENKTLMTDYLKEYGFEGFSISDFMWGVHDGVASAKAGLDMEMPLTMKRGGALVRAVKKGKIEEKVIDQLCENIIATLLRFTNIYRQQHYNNDVICSKPHLDLAQLLLEKGAVLLKNENVLPIGKKEKIAVVGRFADQKVIGDHGSSSVHPPRVITAAQGLSETFENIEFVSSSDIAKCLPAAEKADKIIIVVGNDYKDEGEYIANTGKKVGDGGDRNSLRMHKEDIDLIHAMAKLSKKVVVVYYSGSAIIMEEWKDEVDGILYCGYPGMEGGYAIARLLSGEVNPSGKLPFTIAKDEKDYPDFPNTMDKNQEVEYGYYHGYCKFEKENIEQAFPFGFGLSYTDYKYSDLKASKEKDGLKVSVKVKNIGNVAGEESVLVFVGSGIEGKPHKLLKGFKRIALQPGQDGICEIDIPYNDLRLFNAEQDQFIIPEHFTVYAGKNVEEAENRNVNL